MESFIGFGEILALLIIVSAITIYFFHKARHLERMAQIERNQLSENQNSSANSYLDIKFGMLMIGLGFGMILAKGAEGSNTDYAMYSAYMLLFGGVNLLISYLVVAKLNKRSKK
ncbi:DUF6249 domain-containing protein [uncultured Kordia sp.]|uniref:DUF6249 domain-containing protein n=1 Tax=uncultured Kordia sp. TaxID=507699 RepID=UPI0026272ABA|nr:DUF6249 domain-containing protein [uncultured Kordia sp.]